MNISDDRIRAIAREIIDVLTKDGAITPPDVETAVRRVSQSMMLYVTQDRVLDERARTKVSSLKRNVYEGSPEWEILYNKYYEEELNKL